MQETLIRFLGLEDLLEKGQATHSSILGLSWWLKCKDSACNAGDLGSIPGLGGSPGEGKGYPLQYSWASLVVQKVKNQPTVPETQVRSWVRKIPWRTAW